MYATKEVSKSKVPLIHKMIPLIDGLTSYFDKVIDDDTLHPAVRHSAMRGLMILNKYYSCTDDSVASCIAMSTSPLAGGFIHKTMGAACQGLYKNPFLPGALGISHLLILPLPMW
jgi:hypothetical protein